MNKSSNGHEYLKINFGQIPPKEALIDLSVSQYIIIKLYKTLTSLP